MNVFVFHKMDTMNVQCIKNLKAAGAYPIGDRIKAFIPPKLPKLYLTTDAEYVANLVNVNMWL